MWHVLIINGIKSFRNETILNTVPLELIAVNYIRFHQATVGSPVIFTYLVLIILVSRS
jgi:hypothetical protein